MNVSRSFLAIALLASLPVAPAAAQNVPLPYNMAVPSDRSLSKDDQARDMMNRYGVCVVTQHLGGVRRALALPDDGAITNALTRLATEDCLWNGQLRMSPPLFRGAVYRAIYLRDFGSASPERLAAMKPAGGKPAADVDAAPTYTFGGCVAKLSPDAARDLVMANPATPQEKKAIAELRPTLADCIPPKQQIHLTPWSLQATLAEALYKRTVALTGTNKASGDQ